MFKKMLAILLTMLLLTLPAMAETALTLSDEVLLLQAANDALTARYGLTVPALGLFDKTIARCGDTSFVTYVTNGNIPASLSGEYHVVVTDGKAQAYWTHDDADPALWQSGELTSPAWGVKQLENYLAESPYTRASFCDPYAAPDPDRIGDFISAGGSYLNPTAEDRPDRDAARARAIEAVKAMYRLSGEEAAKLRRNPDRDKKLVYPDGQIEWRIALVNDDVLDPLTYLVTLDMENNTILRIRVESGGIG